MKLDPDKKNIGAQIIQIGESNRRQSAVKNLLSLPSGEFLLF
jgi:hypothetical protein